MTQGKGGGQPTKLTLSLIAAVETAVRSGAPLHWACRYAGISDDAVRIWRIKATGAESKEPRQRSQHERLCRKFFVALEKAEADSFMSGWATILNGSRKSQVSRTTTTSRQVGEEIHTTTVTETKDIAGDWKATAWLLERRFPKDLHFTSQANDGDAPNAEVMPTVAEAVAAIEALRAEAVGLHLVKEGTG